MGSDRGPLPTFIVIGAQKSATRWLIESLAAHPEVYAPDRELEYFNRPSRMRAWGPDGYRAQFARADDRPCVGEACPSYLAWTSDPALVAERIQALVPEVRLLAILRDPVDRAQSAMLHHIRRGRLPDGSALRDAVRAVDPEHDPLGLVSNGWYDACLEPYASRFGDQLLVLLHDDLLLDPAALHQRAAEHIGADPSFVPATIARVAHSNELTLLARLRQRRSIRHRPHAAPLTDHDRREIYAFFRDDVTRLERRLGRDLSAWDPERRAQGAAEQAR